MEESEVDNPQVPLDNGPQAPFVDSPAILEGRTTLEDVLFTEAEDDILKQRYSGTCVLIEKAFKTFTNNQKFFLPFFLHYFFRKPSLNVSINPQQYNPFFYFLFKVRYIYVCMRTILCLLDENLCMRNILLLLGKTHIKKVFF